VFGSSNAFVPGIESAVPLEKTNRVVGISVAMLAPFLGDLRFKPGLFGCISSIDDECNNLLGGSILLFLDE